MGEGDLAGACAQGSIQGGARLGAIYRPLEALQLRLAELAALGGGHGSRVLGAQSRNLLGGELLRRKGSALGILSCPFYSFFLKSDTCAAKKNIF